MKDYSLVILAAGKSSRMGSPKGMLSIGDESLIEFQVRRFLEMQGHEVIVIVEDNEQLYRQKLASYGKKVKFVDNDNIALGPFYSVVLGCKKAIQKNILILPIDVPLMSFTALSILTQEKNDIVIGQAPLTLKGGHPILLREKVVSKLSLTTCYNDRLDHFIEDDNFTKVRVNIDHPYLCLNLNTPDDYVRFLSLE